MCLLDTTHCLGLLFGFPNVIEVVESLGEIEISTNVAVCGELLYGVYKSSQVDKSLDNMERFLRQVCIYDYRSGHFIVAYITIILQFSSCFILVWYYKFCIGLKLLN